MRSSVRDSKRLKVTHLVCTVNFTLSFSDRASEISTCSGDSESALRSTSAVLKLMLGITLTPSMIWNQTKKYKEKEKQNKDML